MKELEEEHKQKDRLAWHEIEELKKTLQILEKELKIEKEINEGSRESVSSWMRQLESLKDEKKELIEQNRQLALELHDFKKKFDEMYRVYSQTEIVVQERIKDITEKLA